MLCEQCVRNTPMLNSEHHFNSSFHLFSYRARSSSFKLWPSFLEDIVTVFNKCIKNDFSFPFLPCQVYKIQPLPQSVSISLDSNILTKRQPFKNHIFGMFSAELHYKRSVFWCLTDVSCQCSLNSSFDVLLVGVTVSRAVPEGLTYTTILLCRV